VGREVTRGGVDAILARYRKAYPTDEARGMFTFSEIEVRPLGQDYALACGKYSLKRTAAGGGDASGRFTLVLRRTPKGWKIIHDHSS
jgi:ketosteroid isomerase-like protein